MMGAMGRGGGNRGTGHQIQSMMRQMMSGGGGGGGGGVDFQQMLQNMGK
jgi:hypothetical protein